MLMADALLELLQQQAIQDSCLQEGPEVHMRAILNRSDFVIAKHLKPLQAFDSPCLTARIATNKTNKQRLSGWHVPQTRGSWGRVAVQKHLVRTIDLCELS